MLRRTAFIAAAAILSTIFCAKASAFRLPAYSISSDDRRISAEDIMARVEAERRALSAKADLWRIDEHLRDRRAPLSKRELAVLEEYRAQKAAKRFWNDVVSLKTSLIALHESPDAKVAAEADDFAKDVIETLYALSQEWKVGSSAIFHNLLVKMKYKKKGYCYHYVDALRGVLAKKPWRYFEFHWGAAWNETVRENNGLVITAAKEPFEDGIVIDAWRTAGRPFWAPVKKDHYPWKELKDVVIP